MWRFHAEMGGDSTPKHTHRVDSLSFPIAYLAFFRHMFQIELTFNSMRQSREYNNKKMNVAKDTHTTTATDFDSRVTAVDDTKKKPKKKRPRPTYPRTTYTVPLEPSEIEYYLEHPRQLRDRRQFERWLFEAENADSDCEDETCSTCGLCKALEPGKNYKNKKHKTQN